MDRPQWGEVMYHPAQELDGRSRCGKGGACRLTSGALRDVKGAKISIRPLMRPNARRCAVSSHHGRKDAGVRTSVPRFLHPVVARVGYEFDWARGSSPTGDPVHRVFTIPLPSCYPVRGGAVIHERDEEQSHAELAKVAPVVTRFAVGVGRRVQGRHPSACGTVTCIHPFLGVPSSCQPSCSR